LTIKGRAFTFLPIGPLPPRRLSFARYLVVGVAVAATHHYFKNLDTIRLIASAVLAVVLWSLLLLGVDLHIKK
jgi:hypothetical protein